MPMAKVISPVRVREKGKFVEKGIGDTVEVSQVSIDAMPNKLQAVKDKPKKTGGAK